MGRKPLGAHPKMSVQIRTDAIIRTWLKPVLRQNAQMSASRMLECLLLMARWHYAAAEEGVIVRKICKAKQQRLEYISKLGKEPEQVLVHLTIDKGICEFADMFKRKFPLLIGSRNELATILLYTAAGYCTDAQRLSYLTRRLEQASHAYLPPQG